MARVALALVVLCTLGAWLVVYLRDPHPSTQVSASKIDPKELMPVTGLYSASDIGKELEWVQVTPHNRRKLFFQVLLPKRWEWREAKATQVQQQQDDKQPVPALEAGPRSDDQALIEVRYVRVPQEVSLTRFIQGLLSISNYQVLAEEDRVLSGGKKVHDALLKNQSSEFGLTLTRMVVSRRGEYIFIVAGSAPAASFDKWAKTFGAAVLSLDP